MTTMERPTGHNLVFWGAVLTGVVWGLGSLVLFASLWLTLANVYESRTIADNIQWYLAGSSMVSMLIGGFTAGWASASRGGRAGWMHGATTWGGMMIASIVVGLPPVLGGASFSNAYGAIGGLGSTQLLRVGQAGLDWAGFTAGAAGLVLATIAGAYGGRASRGVAMGTIGTEDRDERRLAAVPRPAERPELRRSGTE